MKRWNKGWIAGFVLILLLAGCGGSEDSAKEPARSETEDTKDTTEQEQRREEKEESFEASALESAERELTSEELREFTGWLNESKNGNYGFLLSEYTRPEDVDLFQALYTGAGMETMPLSSEEEKAYLAITGDEEIYTDCTRLTTDQINEFLEKKLGLTLEDMSQELPWVYLPDSDAWVWQHGDTNYVNFTCVSGRQTGEDTYELNCVPGDEDETPFIPSCRLTLQGEGEDYRFLSNIYTAGEPYSKEIWKVEDQSFNVDLGAPWGDVLFVTYAPDQSAYVNRDVTFCIVKPSDGAELYEFPAMEEDNYRRNEQFREVQAVSFKDYNGDGALDVIILVEYQLSIYNGEEGDRRQELRLYRSRPEEGDFVLDVDRMDYLMMNGLCHSVEEVMEHIHDMERME